jgi:hypothetical protein
MKLLASFKEQLEHLDKLKYVWLTSFNINIEFIERYLLPAVLDMDPPRNRLDYEHIQLSLTEQRIDFRVFCDKRFMETELNKRTAISVHGISPRRFGEKFSQECLFHPKVIYLEDVNGKKIIGAGSANLTVGGWGRNQEVFRFYEITTQDQYRSVKAFFDTVFDNAGLVSPLPNPNMKSNTDGRGSWNFVHSFQEDTFLEQLFSECDCSDLMVWSPYLPGDLPAFIERLKAFTDVETLKIHLVPDRIEGKYIRTRWSQKLSALMSRGELTFYQNPSARHENVELTHAKVWKVAGRLAIGSWNFTGPGSNTLLDTGGSRMPDNNIEAGFVIEDHHSWSQAVGKELALTPSDFASAELLDSEKLEVQEELPFDIRVNFDWSAQRYDFAGEWHFGVIEDDYWLKVPDVAKPIRLQWFPRKKTLQLAQLEITNIVEELLTEHRFEVHFKKRQVFRGVITETGLPFRRVQAFESLSDLLNAFVSGADTVAGIAAPFRIPADTRRDFVEDDFDDELQTQLTASDADISFFRLFQASKQYGDKIEAINQVTELNQWVFSRPGCLLELVEKAKKKIEKSKPCVFDWFLAQEVHALCRHAGKKRLELGSSGDSLPSSRWGALCIDIPRLPRGIQKGYVNLIQRECKYAR